MGQKTKIRKNLTYGIVVILLLLAGNVFALSFGVSPTSRSYMLLPGAHIETWFTFGTSGGDELGVRVETEIIPADWVSYDPNSFILQPRSQQRVNVTIDIPPDVQPGIYEGRVHARAVPVVDPNLNGSGMVIIGGVSASLNIAIDNEVSFDIVSLAGPRPDVYCTEPFNITVEVANPEGYPIGLASDPNRTHLEFLSGANDVSNSFVVIPEVLPIGPNQTGTFSFIVTPEDDAPLGEVTIIPTIYCCAAFTDGENTVVYGTSRTGLSYDPPFVLSVNVNPDRDRDDDGLYNEDEVNIYGTDPDNPDTDGDNMPDAWEVGQGLNPLVDDTDGDADSDGTSNIEEYYLGTAPKDNTQPLIVYVDCNNLSGIEDGSSAYPYNTIQEGINSPNEPAVIKVKPGTYNERIRLGHMQILEGSGPDSTIIDGQGQGVVVNACPMAWGTWSKITGFTITNGYRDDYQAVGAGIWCDDSGLFIIGNVIKNNHARVGAGGIYFGGSPRPPTISGNIISHNSGSEGGGVQIRNALIINNILAHNSASYSGGAICIKGGFPTIVNNTIVNNSSGYHRSGGIHCSWGPALITNCIIWDNSPQQITEIGGTTLVSYSDIQGSCPGEGNIDAVPCFADPNNGVYHLKSQAGRWNPNSQAWVQDDVTSPCIDAGDMNSPIGFETFPNGGVINMGAYGGTDGASKSYFGEPICTTVIAGDINGDCKVDFADFALMAFHWLENYNNKN